MERYRHGAGVVTYLARYLRGGPIKNAGWWPGMASASPSPVARGRRRPTAGSLPPRMTLPVADFLQRWLLHVPVPQTRVVRSYGLYHHTHAEALARLPGAVGPAARGGPGRAGLADGVCPAGRRAPGTVSDLRAAAGVHRGHPAWRGSAACAGWAHAA